MSASLLIRGARQLLTLRGPSGPRRGPALRDLGIIEDGAVLITDGVIAQIGPSRRLENLSAAKNAREIDASGSVVMPGFVDPHTHLVFGPPRLLDYEMRIEGRTYSRIAEAGGGILQSVKAVRSWTPSRLENAARHWLRTMAGHGTTTLEAKSGYGLDEQAELKQLKVVAALHGRPLDIVPTLLGAHAVPPDYDGRPDAFIDWLNSTLLPLVARRRLARFADVYCDHNAFSVPQARRHLQAAQAAGFGLKIHASQFANLGAVELAVELGAASADHLEAIEPPQIEILSSSSVMATLLPASVLHLGLHRYAPARHLIDAGAAVALATDFNPGSSPTPSMAAVISLACSQMRMAPAEAVSAATINAAHALGLAARIGSLEAGKQADLLILALSDYRELPYYFGANHVRQTIKRGLILQEEADRIWLAGS